MNKRAANKKQEEEYSDIEEASISELSESDSEIEIDDEESTTSTKGKKTTNPKEEETDDEEELDEEESEEESAPAKSKKSKKKEDEVDENEEEAEEEAENGVTEKVDTLELPKAQFKKLARRAGIKRVGHIFNDSMKIVNEKLDTILSKSISVMNHMNNSTLTPDHIKVVLDEHYVYSVPKNKKKKVKVYDKLNKTIRNVLKSVHPNNSINKKCLDQIDEIIKIIGRKITFESIELLRYNKKKTISSNEIQTAVKLVIPGELAKHAMAEGQNAVTKFNETIALENKEANEKNKTLKTKTLKSAKSGLIFSPTRIENIFLRNNGFNVGQEAPIYLAGVLEYLTAEIMELAGNSILDNKKVVIKSRNLFIAVTVDEELNELFNKLKISIADSGVLPFIDPKLLIKPKAKKTKSSKPADGTTKPHRFRPGTVSIREIKKQQKLTSKVFYSSKFKTMINAKAKEYNEKCRFHSNTCDFLQKYIEHCLIRLYVKANNIAIRNGRCTVMSDDLDAVYNLI